MNAVVPMQKQVTRFAPDQIDLIKRTICKGATDDELRLFMYQAERTGLDPLARQIYAMKRWDGIQRKEVMSIQTSIDGFRLIAERTGKYAGQDGPYWCGPDGAWVDVWVSNDPPTAARVGVLRSDFQQPCWGVARFEAYAQRTKERALNKVWATMGDVMIAKCAEALALRKAFPQELSGLYTSDEIPQASGPEPQERQAPEAEPVQIEQPTQEPPHDPETGEVISVPRAIAIPMIADEKTGVLNADWRAWGASFIAAIRASKSLAETMHWKAENEKALARMEKEVPKMFKGLQTSANKATAELLPKAE